MKTLMCSVAVVAFALNATLVEAQTPPPPPSPIPIATDSPNPVASDVPIPLVSDGPTSRPIDPTSAPEAPEPTDTPVPESVLDTGKPAIRARARALIAQMESGKFDSTKMTATLKARLTPKLRAAISKELATLGSPSLVTFASLTSSNTRTGVMRAYAYNVQWANAKTSLTFSLDASGKLDGFAYDLKKAKRSDI